MKKLSLLFCIVILFFFSCKQDENLKVEIYKAKICSVENPLEELEWLKKEIQTLEKSGYSQYFWVRQANLNDETVFIFGNCNPLWNSRFPVLNCQGKEVCDLFFNCDDLREIKNDTLIWKAQVSECWK